MIIITLVILTLSLVNAQRSCRDLQYGPSCPEPYPSGVYQISIDEGTFTTTDVYYDMTTDGGGWIMIQRNSKNSHLSFDKNWVEYEGFGDLEKDFWAGLKLMNIITRTGQWEMRVDYYNPDVNRVQYLHYSLFSVADATTEYRLTVGGYDPDLDALDRFADSNQTRFSTRDNDNENWPNRNKNCVAKFKSGWWYHDGCSQILINAPRVIVGGESLFAEIKIRPKN